MKMSQEIIPYSAEIPKGINIEVGKVYKIDMGNGIERAEIVAIRKLKGYDNNILWQVYYKIENYKSGRFIKKYQYYNCPIKDFLIRAIEFGSVNKLEIANPSI